MDCIKMLLFLFFPALSLGAALHEGLRSQDVDLVSMIQESAFDRSAIVQRGLQLVQSLHSAPSCNRLATATLLDSCKTLEPSDDLSINDGQLILDRFKSTFAARLAICEITGANANIPEQCLSLVPRPEDSKSQSLRCKLPGAHCALGSAKQADGSWGYVKVDRHKLKQCLKALESRPQWWISYSNARQNAVVLCHAARYEREQAEVLQTFESLIEVTADASETLHRATQQTEQQILQQRRFAHDVAELQAQLLTENELSRGKLQAIFGKLLQDTEVQIKAILGSAVDKSKEAATNFDQLNKDIQKSGERIKARHSTLHQGISDLQVLTGQEAKMIQFSMEQSLHLGNTLNTINDHDLKQIKETAQQTQKQMNSLVHLILEVHNRLASNEQGMEMLGRTVQTLQAQATIFEQGYHNHTGTMHSFWKAQEENTQRQITFLLGAQASAEQLAIAVDKQTSRIPDIVGSGMGWLWFIAFLLPWTLDRLLGRSMAGLLVAASAGCVVLCTMMFRLITSGSAIAVYFGIVHALTQIHQTLAHIYSFHCPSFATMSLAVVAVGIAAFLFAICKVNGWPRMQRNSAEPQLAL